MKRKFWKEELPFVTGPAAPPAQALDPVPATAVRSTSGGFQQGPASLPVAAPDNKAPPALAMVHPSTPPNSRSPGEVWSLKNPPTAPAPDFSWQRHGGPPQAPSTPTHKPRATNRSARAPAPAPARSSTLVVPAVVKKFKADQKSQTEKVSTNQAEEAARLAKLKAQTESQER